jgi:pyruvyltransferase
VTIVPNHNDLARFADTRVVSPLSPVHEVIGAIARSEFVCGTSLHAIVIAEAYGIPARLIRSAVEPPFKYDDYYAGTGRERYSPAGTVDEAIALGGEPPAVADVDALLAAFPVDLNEAEAR